MPSRFEDSGNETIPTVKFTGPGRYLFWMTVFLAAVGVIAVLLIGPLEEAFMANMAINGLIVVVLLIGILYTYLQALSIAPAARWLVRFRTSEDSSSLPNPPSMIAPMASMMGDAGSRVRISTNSVRTVLDSVGARMAESGAFTRYFGRLADLPRPAGHLLGPARRCVGSGRSRPRRDRLLHRWRSRCVAADGGD
jgi:hypothetical protein